MYKEWEDNNKKNIILIVLFLILIVLLVIYILSFKNNNILSKDKEIESSQVERVILLGSRTIEIEEGEKYIEPGYYAVTKDGEIKKEEIEVTGSEIDTTKPGTYYISYTIGSKKEQRKIIVTDKEEPPKEDKTDTETIIEEKTEDNNSINNDQKEEIIEKPLEVSITPSTSDYTNKNITLYIQIQGDKFNYMKNPDGTVSINKNSSYEISKNGKYVFIVYDEDNRYIKKEIVINNIDKELSTGSCTASVTRGKTIIEVNGKDAVSGIKNYVYYGDSKEIKSGNIKKYEYNKQLSAAYVNIYDKAGNITKVNCKMIKDSTVQEVINTNASCKAILKDGKTTITVTGNNIKSYNYNGEYQSNNSTYQINKYIRENNYVLITDINGKESKITCPATLETLPVVNPISGSKLKYSADTDSLKVKIVYYKGIYLGYVWAKDASYQFFKQHGYAKPADSLKKAVNNNNLKSKVVMGFNASVGSSPAAYNWPEPWKNKEPSPLMITNGVVQANDLNKSIGLYLYYLDGSNQLKFLPKTIKQLTVDERKMYYNQVIESGARNTMVWRPVLIDNYKPTTLSSSFLKKEAAAQWKQALCQIDSNNFIVASSEHSSKGNITYPDFQKYLVKLGCKTAVEFDAGGSSSLLWKPANTTSIKKVAGADRTLSVIMYVTELDS